MGGLVHVFGLLDNQEAFPLIKVPGIKGDLDHRTFRIDSILLLSRPKIRASWGTVVFRIRFR